MLLISVQGKTYPKLVKEVRNWMRADWSAMRAELREKRWRHLLEDKSAEEMWSAFKSIIQSTIAKNVPLKKIKTGGAPMWMSREIRTAIRKKNNLWKNTKRGRSMETYKEEEKRVKRLIRNAKRSLEKSVADRKDRNNRPFYSYIRKKNKTRPTVGPLKNKKGEIIADQQGMAEELNNFFSSVFTDEQGESPTADPAEYASKLEKVSIRACDIRRKIRKLRKEAAAGPDDISPRVLQELEDEVVGPLATIFEASLRTGEVPSD
jgi:hypothetical protein